MALGGGDQQHFVRRDELVAAWKIFTPLLKYIDAGGLKPEMYPYGTAATPLHLRIFTEVIYCRFGICPFS